MTKAARLAPFRCPIGIALTMLCGSLPAAHADDETGPTTVALHANADAAGSEASAPAVDAASLLSLAHSDLPALGPLSIGTPDAGLLVNPVPMPDGPSWTIRNHAAAYATAETIGFIVTAIEAVEARFPGSPRLTIGDISRADGGRLSRHRSHQAGRDADIGFYYARGETPEFRAARGKDLDLPRTWALVRAFLVDTDVEHIFVDRSLISALYAYARDEEGEDSDWLDDVFGRVGDGHNGIIQHVKRHKNHMHVRFFNARAQSYGRAVYPVLLEEGAVPPPTLRHRVRRGETIGGLALEYGVSVRAIRAANGLRGSHLRVGRSYVIPVRRVPASEPPVVVPPRRLPPTRSGETAPRPAEPDTRQAAAPLP